MKNYKSKASWVYSECAEVIKYHGDPRTVIFNAMIEAYQDAINDALSVISESWLEKSFDKEGKPSFIYSQNIQERIAQCKNIKF